MNLGHLLWIMFGPGTWGTGGNLIGWAVCGGLGFFWAHRKAEARNVRVLALMAQHHFERLDQAERHADEIKRQLTAHCSDIKDHVTAQTPAPRPGDRM